MFRVERGIRRAMRDVNGIMGFIQSLGSGLSGSRRRNKEYHPRCIGVVSSYVRACRMAERRCESKQSREKVMEEVCGTD